MLWLKSDCKWIQFSSNCDANFVISSRSTGSEGSIFRCNWKEKWQLNSQRKKSKILFILDLTVLQGTSEDTILDFFLKGWFITLSHLPLLCYESSWFCHSFSKTEVMTLLYLRRVLIHIKKQSPSPKFTTVVNLGKNTGTVCSISNFLIYILPSTNLLLK